MAKKRQPSPILATGSELMPGGPDPFDLTPKQRVFVDHYVATLDAKKAAQAAGYSKTTARSWPAAATRSPKALAAIRAGLAERIESTGLDPNWVVAKYMDIMDKAMEPVAIYNKDGELVDERPRDLKTALAAVAKIGEAIGMSGRVVLEHRVGSASADEGAQGVDLSRLSSDQLKTLADIHDKLSPRVIDAEIEDRSGEDA